MRAIGLTVAALAVVVAKTNTWTLRAQGNPRIIKGEPTVLGQFPYQALILNDELGVCGGSLITTTKVLTAAHCIVGSEMFMVKLGSLRLFELGETAWISLTQWALVHPQFAYSNETGAHYDVGIVFLMEPAPLGRNINLVALPSPLEVHNSFKGETALVAGFGIITNITDEGVTNGLLRWTKLTVMSDESCLNFWPPSFISEATLCAADRASGVCSGDSGSPLVIKTNRGYKQIGVTSFVSPDGCGLPFPDVFARVTSVLDWITRIADDTVY